MLRRVIHSLYVPLFVEGLHVIVSLLYKGCCSCRWGETVLLNFGLNGLLFIPQMIYESGEPWWNDIHGGKPKNSERNLSQCHFFQQISHGPARVSAVRNWRLNSSASCKCSSHEKFNVKNTFLSS
jgi:hypothetical protein